MINPIRLIIILLGCFLIFFLCLILQPILFPAASIESAETAAILTISILLPLLMLVRTRKAKTNLIIQKKLEQEMQFNLKYLAPVLTFTCASLFIFQASLWWIFANDLYDSIRGGIFLLCIYIYIFNDLPKSGLSIVKTKKFKTIELPILVVSTAGYLGSFVKKLKDTAIVVRF